MNPRESPRKQLRPLGRSESKKVKTPSESSRLSHGSSESIPWVLSSPLPPITNKLHKAKEPKDCQEAELKVCPHQSSADGGRNAPEATLPGKDSQKPDFAAWLKFDENGMICTHSFLGSCENFRKYLEGRGETELARKIPKSPDSFDQLFVAPRSNTNNVESERPSYQRNIQSNALQNWDKHVQYHRRQQDELSYKLNRPVKFLQMNEASHFREIREPKDHHVGSEFWSLPERIGDEMSGITATLTQTERGQKKPVTHAGKPSCIQKELGHISVQPQCRSACPQHQCQEVKELLQEMDINKPDISKLEVIGSGKAFTSTTVGQRPLLEKKEEEKEHKDIMKEHLKPQAEQDNVQVKVLSVPALRIHGKLASWTGNSTARKGEVGISTSIFFETQTGENLSSDVELYNEGNTVIFYSWEKQIVPPSSFNHLIKPKHSVPFYFNFSSGVILPGKTQRVACIYEAADQGYRTELWKLNTHPLLMEGASIQVRFAGVAFSPDKNKDRRLFLEQQLEKKVTLSMCRSLVDEILDRVHSPQRPSSPTELYITEEQKFENKNPQLYYQYQPVEDLKSLWQKVNPGGIWDFSIDTLDQVVMSYEEPPSASLTQEEASDELNSLYLQLAQPPDVISEFPLTVTFMEEVMHSITQEKISNEAIRLRKAFGIPEMEMCVDGKQKTVTADADDKLKKIAVAATTEENKGMEAKFKGDTKGQSKTSLSDSSTEEIKGIGKSKDDAGGSSRELHMKGSASEICLKAIPPPPPDDRRVDPEMMRRYLNALHKKVYTYKKEMTDNLAVMLKDIDNE